MSATLKFPEPHQGDDEPLDNARQRSVSATNWRYELSRLRREIEQHNPSQPIRTLLANEYVRADDYAREAQNRLAEFNYCDVCKSMRPGRH